MWSIVLHLFLQDCIFQLWEGVMNTLNTTRVEYMDWSQHLSDNMQPFTALYLPTKSTIVLTQPVPSTHARHTDPSTLALVNGQKSTFN